MVWFIAISLRYVMQQRKPELTGGRLTTREHAHWRARDDDVINPPSCPDIESIDCASLRNASTHNVTVGNIYIPHSGFLQNAGESWALQNHGLTGLEMERFRLWILR